MHIALMLLFALAAAINVIACALGCQPVRKASKTLLMPLLIGVALTGAKPVPGLVVAALACGWVADVFLLRTGSKPAFALGLAAFLVGHVLYLLAVVRTFALTPPVWACVGAPVLYYGFVLSLYVRLRPRIARALRPPAVVYVLTLATVATLGAYAFFSGNAGGVYLLVGTVCFLVSDAVLSVQTFAATAPSPPYDFTVMLTYLAAQALITTSFLVH